MKYNRYNWFLTLLLALPLASCVTNESTTTTTAPDGTTTVIRSKTTAPDSASVAAASGAAGIVAGFMPQPRVIGEK